MRTKLAQVACALVCSFVAAGGVAAPAGVAGLDMAAGTSRAALPGVTARAVFGWPLAGLPEVARPFEPPPHQFGAGHRGVDLYGSPGQPVLAAGDGTVAFAGMVAGRPVVSIDHAGGLRTTYEPVAAEVVIGQFVRRGDVLGTLQTGHPGCPALTCLHWGVRRGEEYLDPLRLLASGRVRLLPTGPVGGGS
jgi:murein DD-endopeptidase MepM/ murein hydrolase activator NlpD